MRITTSARSGLGHALALVIVAVPLIVMGAYMALGDLTTGDSRWANGVINSVFSSTNSQQMVRALSDSLAAHFRRFGRVELIVYYGIAIFAGFAIQGVLGRFLRSYSFTIWPRKGVIERREMWLVMPGWLGVCLAVLILLYLVVNTGVAFTVRVPFWVVFGGLGGVIGGWILWAWAPGLVAGRTIVAPWTEMRISLWWLVLPLLMGVLMLVGLGAGWTVRVGIPMPVRLVVAGVAAVVSAVVVWVYVPWLGRRTWFVPGFKSRMELGKIKRMEVLAETEGGTALIVTFGDDWTWVICRNRPQRLQQLGAALGRLMKLTRRDPLMWGRT